MGLGRVLDGFGEGFGRGLGGSGSLLGALGGSCWPLLAFATRLAAFWLCFGFKPVFKGLLIAIHIFSYIFRDPMDFWRVWKCFLEGFGGIWEAFGRS